MIVYILTILFTVIMAYFADLVKQSNKALSFVFVALLPLACSLLAAFRDTTVGLDVHVYETELFAQCMRSDDLWSIMMTSRCEPFFVLINYIAAATVGKINAAFFLMEYFILLFVSIGSYRMRHKVPYWLTTACFLLGYYMLSYNLMRQSLAIAWLCMIFADFLLTRRYLRFFLLSLVGILFHKTILVASVPLIYIFWSVDRKTELQRFILAAVMCVGMICIFFAVKIIFENLGAVGLDQYAAYGGVGKVFRGGVIKEFFYTDFAAIVLVCVAYYLLKVIDSKQFFLMFMVLCVDLFFQAIGHFATFASRMGMYTIALYPYLYPTTFQNDKIHKRTYYILIAAFVALYILWFAVFAIHTTALPYSSEILDY